MTKEELMESGYRLYEGKAIEVYFNLGICQHSGNCVKGNHDVFNTHQKPWIKADEASAEEIARVIDTCPSNALKYRLKKEL